MLLFLFAFFLYGVYIGTVNNNYIHDKKHLLLNCKTIVRNYFEQININVENINIKLSKTNRKSLQNHIEKAVKTKIINKDSTKWLKAKISVNKTESAGKVKIKGLFLDEFEWKENCFSYSVKLENYSGDIQRDTTACNSDGRDPPLKYETIRSPSK